MDLSHNDIQTILKLIDASSLEEVEIEIGDFRLAVRRRAGGGSGPAPPSGLAPAPPDVTTQPAPEAAPVGAPASRVPVRGRTRASAPVEGEFTLTAPMVGTFYRAPAPGAPPFVEPGGLVGPDDVVCIIEVMKLMTSISAGRKARVVEILADNGAPVEYGQPLMIFAPMD
jgi:acetyl-CoA carboxylase biotin carboxyl carrier protein